MQWNQKELNLKGERLLLFIESVLCLVLLVSVCFNNNVWWDEAYSYDLVSHNTFWGICVGTAIDVHPPLYYLLAKAVTLLFGNSLFVFKMTSIAANVAIMALGMTKVYRRFGLKTSAIFIFLSCFAPQMAFYAVQLRMYSWASFFVLASAVYGYEILCENKKSDWVLFVLFSLGGAYTLYFACISISAIYLFLLLVILVKRRDLLKRFLIACGATVAGYLPWLFVFLTVTFGGLDGFKESMPETTLGEIIGKFWLWAFESNVKCDELVYGGLIVLALAAVWLAKAGRPDKTEPVFATVLLLIPVYTIFFGKILNDLATRRLLNRYIEPTLILIWLAFSVGIARYKNRVFYLAMGCVVLLGVENYRYVYHDEYHVAPLIHETENFIETNMEPGDVVVYELEPYELMYRYYMPEQELVYYENLDLEQFTGKSFWYIDAWGGYFDAETVEAYGLQREECGNFGIQSMDFKIYRITVAGNGK